MKKKIKNSLISFLLLLLTGTGAFGQPCKEIVGYYYNGSVNARTHLVKPSSIVYSKYTIIDYAFFNPDSAGFITQTDSLADRDLLLGQINLHSTPASFYPN